MSPDYMSMSGYGQRYQPLPAFALTQPAPIPSWQASMPAPVQRTFPVAMPDPVAGSVPSSGLSLFSGAEPGFDVPTLGGVPAVPPAAGGGGWNWLSTRDKQGVLGPAFQGISALGSLYMGMNQYNLAKETLAANKAQFERNFDAQKATTNASLEDRQRARVASNPGAYQSVGDYMNQNGVR